MISLLSLAKLALATEYILSTESSNDALNEKGLTGLHEGAGISTVFLSDDTSSSIYEYENHTFYNNINKNIVFQLGEYAHTLSYGVVSNPLADLNSGYVTLNGSADVFYVCPGYVPFDLYNYASRGSLGVSIYAKDETHPENCEPIKIAAMPYTN